MVSGQSPSSHHADRMSPLSAHPNTPSALTRLAANLDIAGIERPAERAYQGIRRAILSGAMAGGAHLREEALAEMTGTSRTPVRDALSRLVTEGLARAENRSRFVADFSYEEVTVIFDIRARLEGYAARLAARNIRDDELDAMTRHIDEIDALADEQTEAVVQRFATLNTLFHQAIIRATRSTQMQSLSAQAISLPLEMIKKFVWEQRVNIHRSNSQHRDILEALRARNPDWAETAMAAHILSTRPFKAADAT